MTQAAILWPVLAMVALTFAVSVVMYRRRLNEIRTKRIRPQTLASAHSMGTLLEDTRAADNYRNLLEQPVLFYVAALAALALKIVSPPLVALAWIYVACRVVHTAIHCSTNRVKHRFFAFVASHAALLALWLVLAVGIATWVP